MPGLKPLDALQRHDRIAFQFSGGKDSTAALYLLREHWHRMTVYWLDSGDIFPEVRSFITRMQVPIMAGGGGFVRVDGRVPAVIAEHGPPSDLIGADASAAAWAAGIGKQAKLQDRALCCIRGKMVPLQERMVADGITLIVRGQKLADEVRGPLRSGDSDAGIEVLHPIEDWSDADVMAWLIEHDLVPPLYEHGITRSGDCMRCSAWLGDRRAEYLARHHPDAFADFAERVFMSCRAADGPVGRVFGEARAIAAAVDATKGTP